ncbi:MAG: multicopper oxidase domain-containing protein, partial [bacterium]
MLFVAMCVFAAPAAAQQPSPPPKTQGMAGMIGMPGAKQDTSKAKKKTPASRSAKPPMVMSGDHAMDGMEGMVIPMPKGMPMIPGLVGLSPDVTPFLPGIGVDPKSLPFAKPSQVMRLNDGDTLDLTAMLVRRTIKGHSFVMYAFNGQSPGPLIRVAQNATITVRFHNRIDLPSAVHWHGVRLDNRSDGVPGVTQDEVAPGRNFVYSVHFPDAGLYWYHPHVREDVQQAMGLFGNMRVDPPETNYYSPVNREQVMLLSDLLVNGDTLITFGKESPNYVLMGRVGNVLLVNGEPRYTTRVKKGDV